MKSKNSIVKSSVMLAILVCLGKILGFIKQSVIAWAFGANKSTDVFFAADGFTSTILLVLSNSIAPAVLTSYLLVKNRKGKHDADKLINSSLSFFFVVSLVLVLFSCVFANQITNVIGLSYSTEQKQLLSRYVRELSIGILFSSAVGVFQGCLNAENKFAPGRLASLFYSVFSIIAILSLRKVVGVQSLIIGFLTGYFLHGVLMLLYSRKIVSISVESPLGNADFKQMLRKFFPLMISLSIVDFGHLIDRIVASSLAGGSVSALNYGQVVSSDLVNAVIITTVGTVLLSSFTDRITKGESTESVVGEIRNVLCTVSFLIVIVSALFLVESEDFVEMLLQRGNFDNSNTITVSGVAIMYAVGFVFMSTREVLIKAHYAYQDMKAPVINSAVGVLLNLVLSILLSRRMGVSGIALATSISLSVISALSIITLKKHIGVVVIDKTLLIDIVKVLISACFSVMLGLLIRNSVSSIHHLIRMVVVGLTMCFVYCVISFLLKEKSVSQISRSLIRFIRRDESQSAE